MKPRQNSTRSTRKTGKTVKTAISSMDTTNKRSRSHQRGPNNPVVPDKAPKPRQDTKEVGKSLRKHTLLSPKQNLTYLPWAKNPFDVLPG